MVRYSPSVFWILVFNLTNIDQIQRLSISASQYSCTLYKNSPLRFEIHKCHIGGIFHGNNSERQNRCFTISMIESLVYLGIKTVNDYDSCFSDIIVSCNTYGGETFVQNSQSRCEQQMKCENLLCNVFASFTYDSRYIL